MKARPFTSTSSIDRMLATVTEPVLLAMIEDASKRANLIWLERLRATEVFKAPALDPLAPVEAMLPEISRWASRCKAAMALVKSNQPDTVHANLHTLTATDEVKRFFHDLIKEVAATSEAFKGVLSSVAHDLVVETIGSCAALACALDLPQTIHAINAHGDAYKTALLSLGELNLRPVLISPFEPKVQTALRVSPYLVALQFDRRECLTALLGEDDYVVRLGGYDGAKFEAFSILGSLTKVSHVCSSNAFEVALQHFLANPVLQDEERFGQLRYAIDILDPLKDAHRNIHLLPAFLNSGIFDRRSFAAITAAISIGETQVLDRYEENFPWGDGFNGAFWRRPSPLAIAISAGHNSCALRLINLAARDDHLDMIERSLLGVAPNSLSGVSADALMTQTAGPVVARLLELNVINPSTTIEGGTTLLSHAEALNPTFAQIIRSVAARQSVKDLVGTLVQAAVPAP